MASVWVALWNTLDVMSCFIVKTIRNHPVGNGLYNPFMVIQGFIIVLTPLDKVCIRLKSVALDGGQAIIHPLSQPPREMQIW